MPGRTAFESPSPEPAPSAVCSAAGPVYPVYADVTPGFEPPEPVPAPSTTLLFLCPAEEEPAAQTRTKHLPSEEVDASEAHEAAEADLAPSATTPTDGQAGMSVFPPVGDVEDVARWTVEIIEWSPHDSEAFTQGLEVAGGIMYESTGLWGRSSLRAVNPATGEVTARVDLPDQFFGEGLTVAGDEIIQLTWQSGTALVYDRATLEPLREHSYEGEGWGLCEMGRQLIMTDGSDRLARRDLDTFELLHTVAATASGYDGRLDHLNELECVEGMVIANVWQTDHLLVIDPDTGQVVAAIDAGPLVDDASQASAGSPIDVLNGVAMDEKTATLWMTGKLWPRLYRVRVVEVP